MKLPLKTFLAATTLLLATPAIAVPTFQENNGQLATHVNADDKDDGNLLTRYGSTGNNPSDVLFTGNTEINITGGGFALINDVTGPEDFYSLIVNPDDGFSQIDFSLQFIEDAAYFTVEYDLVGDALGFILLGTYSQDSGLSDYLLDGTGDGLVFDAIRITSVTGAGVSVASPIDFEKQNSLTLVNPIPPTIPEPATWAMMLLGFGAAGYSMRRYRRIGIRQVA